MQKSKKSLNLIGQLLLLITTLIWGSSFVILKQALESVPLFYVLAVRFTVSGVVMLLIVVKKLKGAGLKTLKHGVILGLVLVGAYTTQTFGLKFTTPGRNAFLTSTYCVICPFLIWIFYKIKPKSYNLISAFLCILGVGLISLSGADAENGGAKTLLGDGLTLICAIFYAVQIILIDNYNKERENTGVLLMYEVLTAGIVFSVLSLIFELPKTGIHGYALSGGQLLRVAYLTFVATLITQAFQMIGQSYTTPSQASIIMTLEAVFGTMFSLIFKYEVLTAVTVIGFIVIFVAMLITELKFDPFKALKKRAAAKFEEEKVKENADE